MPKGMHNPLPASLRSECKKATQILDSFINGSWRGSPGRELPRRFLANAKGVAILTITKAGLLGSLRFGSGILLARLDDNTWSSPSAVATVGVGFGGQAGFELTDFVFILTDEDSVRTFSRVGSLTLSGNFSFAFGPVGRNAEISGGANVGIGGVRGGKMVSFCKTKGLFGGVSVESGVIVERRRENRKFYQDKKVTAGGILGGDVRGNGEEVEGLMKVLAEVFGEDVEERLEGGLESRTGDTPAVDIQEEQQEQGQQQGQTGEQDATQTNPDIIVEPESSRDTPQEDPNLISGSSGPVTENQTKKQ